MVSFFSLVLPKDLKLIRPILKSFQCWTELESNLLASLGILWNMGNNRFKEAENKEEGILTSEWRWPTVVCVNYG